MARIKTSAIISDIRGKIGGSVFQQSRGGLVFKNAPFASKRISSANSKVYALNQMVRNAWRNLTSYQLSAWVAFAGYSQVMQKNNKSLFLSANDLFYKTNFIRLLYGYDLLITPEFSKCQFLPITASLQLSGLDLVFQTSRVLDSLKEFVSLKVSPPLLPSVNSAKSRLRSVIFSVSDSDTFIITSEYLEALKRFPVSGNALLFSYTNVNLLTGLQNNLIQSKIIL